MKKNVILILAVLSISLGLFGQFGYYLNMFEPEIIDARAEALGRTSILSSSGANFIFNNPAMLSNLEQNNMQISGRAIYGKSEVKENIDYETEKSEYKYPPHMKINGVSFSIPYDMPENNDFKLGLGVGYRAYYDFSYNKHYEIEDDYDIYEYDYKYHGGFSTLVFGGGFNYQNKLLGGISISFPFLSNISSEYEDSDDNHEESEGTIKGTFVTSSGAYILNEEIIIAARLRTGFNLEREEEYEERYDFESDISIPSEFGLAIELIPNSTLKLYVEYLTRNFGDYEIESDFSNFDLYNNSDNGYSFRIGFEKGSDDVFRGGFFMQSIPIYEIKYSDWSSGLVYDDEPEIEMGFTAGFGYKIKPNFSLDLFGAFSFVNYDEIFNADNWRDQVSYDYSFSRIKVGCSMGYNF